MEIGQLSPNRQSELKELCEKLRIPFTRLEILNQALTHSSYKGDVIDAHNARGEGTIVPQELLTDYERMEFFGDAVLKFVASEYLFRRFENYPEGRLTEIRAVLVSSSMLEEMANALDLGKYILMGRRVNLRASILARSMEAIFGAVYLDSGFEHVTPLIIRLLEEKADQIHQDASLENFKARLQIYTQSKKLGIPVYEIVEKRGPDHDPFFIVQVSVSGKVCGQGSGHSRKLAEQQAAKEALAKFG